MKKSFSITFLRDEVARIIAPSLITRRLSQIDEPDQIELEVSSAQKIDETLEVFLNSPPTEMEVDEFIAQCPFEDNDLTNNLLQTGDAEDSVDLSDEEFSEFLQSVEDWSGVNSWLGADDWPVLLKSGDIVSSRQFALFRQTRFETSELAQLETKVEIARLSPSFGVLEKLLTGGINLDALHWRELEELVAELLTKDGYKVELGRGRNDGGKDIIAIKDLGESGLFKSVWQAKKLKPGNKVGIEVIRELADTRNEQKASKGIIVTTTFLTSGALQRVKRDEYVLGKVEKDDLTKWIDRILRGKRT